MSEALPRAKRMTSEEKLEARLEEVGAILRQLVAQCRDLEVTVAAGGVTKARVATLTDGIIGRCEVASTAVVETEAYHDAVVSKAKAKGKPAKNQPKGLVQSRLPVIRRPMTADMATQTVEVVDPRGPDISVPGEAQGASPRVVVGDKTPPSKKGGVSKTPQSKGKGKRLRSSPNEVATAGTKKRLFSEAVSSAPVATLKSSGPGLTHAPPPVGEEAGPSGKVGGGLPPPPPPLKAWMVSQVRAAESWERIRRGFR